MKNIAICLILSLLSGMTTGCAFEQDINGQAVDCIGVQEEADPRYVYKVSVRNVVVVAFLSPSIVIPIIWLVTSVKCPVRRRHPAEIKNKARQLQTLSRT